MTETENISNLIYEKILSNKDSLLNEWNNPQGVRTKHLIIENLLPERLCKNIYDLFPSNLEGFHFRNSFRERKKTSANMNIYDKKLNSTLYAFQDKKIIELISEITKIYNLEPDKKLYAGGLSIMGKGDFLNPHIDNSHNMQRNKYRRLNLLYYVSPEWNLKCGGNFELWDKKVKSKKTIVSSFNKLIIMETTEESWHSVNKVLVDNLRCCVSNYYFSENSPIKEKDKYFHVTSFTGRPNEKFKRFYGYIDNYLRNILAKKFKVGRGKNLINKKNNN